MRIYVLLLSLSIATPVEAEVKSWTNSNGGSWSAAANWSPNGAPAANDVAIITNAGNYTVTLDLSSTIAGLVLGGKSGTQTLAIAWETTLVLQGSGWIASGGQLLLAGTLSGTNHLLLEGSMSWSAGTVDTYAVLELAANGSLVIGGGAEFGKALLGSVTNAGVITYKPYGGLAISGTLCNLAGGLVDVQSPNRDIYKGQPTAAIVNAGIFRISSGGLSCEVPMINSGTVNTQVGKLALTDGSVFNDGSRFIGAGVTRLDNGTNFLNGGIYSENLAFYGASITGTGSLSGTVTWGAGSIDYGAAVLIATNGQLIIGGGANYSRILRGSLTNAGTILYEPPGPFGLAGPLHNLAGGLFEIRWDNSVFNSGPGGLFINDGMFRKSAGVATAECEVPLINSGTVDTETGRLVLTDGSVFNDGSRFTGAGVTRLDKGTNFLHGGIYSENLVFYGASITGTGSLSGTVTWGAGSIDYGAAVLIATNGQLVVGGGANYSRILRGSLTNAGTILYEPPGPFGLAGPLHNLAGGLFEIRWDNNVFNSGSDGRFINDGTFRKAAGAATAECQVPFLNRGTVDIPSGRLYFAGPFDQPSGDLLLRSGTFRSDQPLNLAGGRLLGWGTVATDVNNAGATVSPGSSNGVITINGTYTQRIGGSVEFTLGGTNPGTNLGHLKVSEAVALNGTIAVRLLQPYLPAPGDAFSVMSFASRKGDFARRNGLILLGHNRCLIPTYGPRTLSLVTLEQPDPTDFSLRVGIDGNAALVSWPLEFGGGTLRCCTNFAQPEWVVVPAPQNQFLDQPMVEQKFFRLSIP